MPADTGQLSDPLPKLQAAVGRLEPLFTAQEKFQNVSRGRPVPYTHSPEQLAEAQRARDTWRLEILADLEARATLGRQFQAATQTAIDFQTLLQPWGKNRFALRR